MRASVNWLRELSGLDASVASVAEIAARLTAAGLEVEGRSSAAGFSGVVVAEIRGSRPHPQADSLRLVDVFDGSEVVAVVCGAPTLPPVGARVAWARPGATLPGGRAIAAREIRGVTSPGMLCAEDELGLGASHAGLLELDRSAPPGSDAAVALGVDDTLLELNVTPNRPDWMSHLGVARELCALFPGATLRPPESRVDVMTSDLAVDSYARVAIDDAAGCPRYLARVVNDVAVKESPRAVRRLLESLGLRAISNVVDATNLVLLELGHPLHAFDLDRLAGGRVVVRRARAGETIVTLDGVERRLEPEDVVIADDERAVAVAGVMGGREAEVGPSTKRILLESACFDPPSVRRTARRLGLRTEASQRFERGADPNAGVARASARCARLIAEWSGGRLAAGAIDVYPRRVEPRDVALRPARTERVLGAEIPVEEQVRLLRALQLEPIDPILWAGSDPPSPAAAAAVERIVWRVPTFRPDLTREVDLIEEVARLHGLDRLPATLPRASAAPPPPRLDLGELVRDGLRALGLHETISFGFTGPDRIARLGYPAGHPRSRTVRVANPLREEQSVMRTSLLPGLLGALAHNLTRGVGDVRLFEVGEVFIAGEGPLPEEHTEAAAVLAGQRDGWLKPGGELDFFDAKGLLEGLLAALDVRGAVWRPAAPGEAPWLHPGVGAVLEWGGAACGAVGELHPELRRVSDVDARAFAFELDLGRLGRGERRPFESPPRHPGSARDISFFVAVDVPAAALRDAIAGASPLIEAVRVLEDYREAGRVPEGQKGMLFSVGYRAADRTVTDEEVTREHARVLAALAARFAVAPR